MDAQPRQRLGGRLAGKVAVVTGAASGIGLATALAFSREGASVVAVDRAADRLAVAADDIAVAGAVRPFVADVTKSSEIAAMVDFAMSSSGRIDVLVNNAGAENSQGGLELDEAEWDRQFSINLKSVFLVTKAVWPVMERGGGGAILNAGSICGSWVAYNAAAYSAAKAGVAMLTKCLAVEGGALNIRVNCVQPGYTLTPNMQRVWSAQPEGAEARRIAITPLNRAGLPEDVAAAYLYLASDDASMVTGVTLNVDGGTALGAYMHPDFARRFALIAD